MTNEKKAKIIAKVICPFMDGAMQAAACQFILQSIIQPRKSAVRAGIYVAGTFLTMVGQEKLINEFEDAFFPLYDRVEEHLLEIFEKKDNKTE